MDLARLKSSQQSNKGCTVWYHCGLIEFLALTKNRDNPIPLVYINADIDRLASGKILLYIQHRKPP
jgi:hypothetical protein